MKNYRIKLTMMALAIGVLSLSLHSCKKTENPDTEPVEENSQLFGIGGTISSPFSSYLLQNGSLTSGAVSFLGAGANVSTIVNGFFAFIVKDGYYYSYMNSEKTFAKYTYENQVMKRMAIIPCTIPGGLRFGHDWIDDHTLFLYGQLGDYKIIDVKTMTVTKEGNLKLPKKEGFNLFMGFAVVKGGKLYTGYSYGDDTYPASVKQPGKKNYATGTAYFAVYDFPSMKNVIYSEDSRSTNPGNDRDGVLKTFVYNDDLYITTAPIELCGQNFDKPTGIFRFKNGETKVDPTYFFDLSAKLNGDFLLGGAYAGKGKVLVRRMRMDLFKDFNSYSDDNIQEYHIVDVASNSITKLNVPLSKSTSTSPNILVDDTKIYFPVNTKDVDGNFHIYNYDLSSGTVSKGISIENMEEISGLFRIK